MKKEKCSYKKRVSWLVTHPSRRVLGKAAYPGNLGVVTRNKKMQQGQPCEQHLEFGLCSFDAASIGVGGWDCLSDLQHCL